MPDPIGTATAFGLLEARTDYRALARNPKLEVLLINGVTASGALLIGAITAARVATSGTC